jgi:putative aldouronate transport system substrate-binding protein
MRKKLSIVGVAAVLLATWGQGLWAEGSAEAPQAPVVISVEVFDRSQPGFVVDNNWDTNWIGEQVKNALNMTIKWVPVPRSQEVPKLSVLMAAGDAPDLSFVYDTTTFQNWIQQGGLTALDPFIAQYGQSLVKYLGDDQMLYGRFNGKQWAVPAKRVLTPAFSGYVRKDWLDKLGMAIPANKQQFFAMLQAFKDKDPGNTGGKVIPLGIQGYGTDIGNVDWSVRMLLRSYITAETQEQRYSLWPEGCWIEPGYKDGMRKLNELYTRGLVSPDFALDKDGKQYERDLQQGKMGSAMCNYDWPYRSSPGIAAELAKNVPGGTLVPFDAFENYQGKYAKMKYATNGLFLFVPSFSKNAAGVIQYLNWMSNLEVIKILQNGIKGQQYTDEVDGIPSGKIAFDKLPDNLKFQVNDFPILVNGFEFGSPERNITAAATGYPGYESLIKQAIAIGMKDAYPPPWIDQILTMGIKYDGPVLFPKAQEIFTKTIMCKPSEFDALYDSLVKDYLASGGQAVIDEKAAAYRQMVKAGTVKE